MTPRIAPLVAVVGVFALLSAEPAVARQASASGAPGQPQESAPAQPKAKPAPQSEKPTPAGDEDHSAHTKPDQQDLPPFIARPTDEDRKAAFPDVQGHTVHDNAMHFFVLFDQLEWQAVDDGSGINVDSKGWIGRDKDRLWFRAEAESEDGHIGEAEAHVLYGRQISTWWDLVLGVRQDVRPGEPQTWAAFGVQGLAPYWFEVEATGYVREGGRTEVRLELEYELLLTKRLVLQPLIEAQIFGKDDPERGLGAGLSTTDIGIRLRYEVKREIAPYVGVAWNRKWGKTADLAEADGGEIRAARLIGGLRFWF
jgi:copper resistance protein B